MYLFVSAYVCLCLSRPAGLSILLHTYPADTNSFPEYIIDLPSAPSLHLHLWTWHNGYCDLHSLYDNGTQES